MALPRALESSTALLYCMKELNEVCGHLLLTGCLPHTAWRDVAPPSSRKPSCMMEVKCCVPIATIWNEDAFRVNSLGAMQANTQYLVVFPGRI